MKLTEKQLRKIIRESILAEQHLEEGWFSQMASKFVGKASDIETAIRGGHKTGDTLKMFHFISKAEQRVGKQISSVLEELKSDMKAMGFSKDDSTGNSLFELVEILEDTKNEIANLKQRLDKKQKEADKGGW